MGSIIERTRKDGSRAFTAQIVVKKGGAIVYPPVPAFYAKPSSLDEMVDHTLGRVLDLFGIESGTVKRWAGMKRSKVAQPGTE